MSETEKPIVCRHLGEGGQGLGFNLASQTNERDEVWPPAWCDACDDVVTSEGGWTDRALAFADLRLLCSNHYDRARRLNWRQDDIAYANLSSLASAYLERRQDELRKRFSLGRNTKFSLNECAGEVTFSNRKSARLIAKCQIVGGLSKQDESWIWSWATPSVPEAMQDRVRIVRAYGEEHSYRDLASAMWLASEKDAWDMTAIAAYLLDSEGATALSHESSDWYMLVSDVRWVV